MATAEAPKFRLTLTLANVTAERKMAGDDNILNV
jgi:hypothetical protein